MSSSLVHEPADGAAQPPQAPQTPQPWKALCLLARLHHIAADPDTVAYLCGPPGMIHAARAHLEDLGLKPENIFAEQFVASN